MLPSQVSAWSQVPTAARQTNVMGCTPSAGQPSVLPSQLSGLSQMLLAGRQTVVVLRPPQVPFALPSRLLAITHEAHTVLQAALQHTPSTQKPLPHSTVPWQTAPLSRYSTAPISQVVVLREKPR